MISLADGVSTCAVDPDLGGALLFLRRGGIDLLRPAAMPARDVLRTASFPLLPFCNRIADGRFTFAGEAVHLPPDVETPPHAHHGHGWRRAWQVVDHGADHVRLAFDVAAGAWPWPYRAEQTIRLHDDALSIGLAVTNLSNRPMPAGAGIHPYFPRTADSRIVACATAIWTNDDEGVAREPVSDARFRSREEVPIAALEGIDNFFEGDADVTILGGPLPLRIKGTPCAGFHLYVPPGQSFFCVEPVSHPPDSFGRGDYAPGDIVAAGETREWLFEIAIGRP